MKSVKRYSFNDWFEGKVYFQSRLPINPPKNECLLINWDSFDRECQMRILQKQKEIFDSNVIDLTEVFKKRYLKKIEVSLKKHTVLKKEIDACDQVLFKNLYTRDIDGFVYLPQWRFSIYHEDFLALRNYYENTLSDGNEIEYIFIDSPNFKFKRDGVPGEVLAKALVLYQNWLLALKDSSSTENVSPSDENQNVSSNTKKSKACIPKENYSLKAIAIAYKVMGVQITTENGAEILKRHSNFTSVKKLLDKRVITLSDLTKSSENKTVDTKNLKNLEEARLLLSGAKKKNAVKVITRIITALYTTIESKNL